ncbi:MAG: hypothetical protein HUJ55_08825 [Ileibacterium sp.]|nr:hypothetical protein [Ileibacterium sp.]
MKRILTAVLALSLTAGLVGCSGAVSASKTNQTAAQDKTAAAETKDAGKKDDKKEGVPKAEKPFEMKIEKENLGDLTDEQIQSKAKEQGYDEAKKNDDGSYTLKMNVETTNKKIQEVKAQIDDAVKDITSGKNAVKCVKDITCNDNCKEINIKVEKDQFKEEDATRLASLTIILSAIQRLQGKELEEVDAKVNFIDSKTNQNIKTVSYQDLVSQGNSANQKKTS